MATVTYEMDDAIFRKAEELLEGYGLADYSKAMIEYMVTSIATGNVPEVPQSAMDTAEEIKRRIRERASNSYEERMDHATRMAVEHSPEETFKVDIDGAQAVIEAVTEWMKRPEILPLVAEVNKEAENAIMAYILTGVHEGIFSNKTYVTTRVREKLLCVMWLGFYYAWRNYSK